MDKYEWLATESALEQYPMRIIQGAFLCPENISVYIPPDRLAFNGLGEIGSTHLTEEKLRPLPQEILITWFSYTENKFFKASFTIDPEPLATLFETGIVSPVSGEKINYNRIIVGLWPEGKISLFVSAEGVVVEFCFNQGREIDMNWSLFFDNRNISRTQYIESTLKEILKEDGFASYKTNGVPAGLAAKYRKRYAWKPVIVTTANPQDLYNILFNGEHEFINYFVASVKVNNEHPLPKKNILRWSNDAAKKYICFIIYHEPEIFSAFDKLLADPSSGELKLQIEINDAAKQIEVFVANSKNYIVLKQCDIKIYSVPVTAAANG